MKWISKWIWADEPGRKHNQYADFRQAFWLTENEAEQFLRLRISARQEYSLRINGQWVGRGPSPCTPEWQYYDTYDISDYIRSGENVVAAVCYQFGESDIVTGQMQGEAGFLLQIENETGTEIRTATNRTWKARVSPSWRTTNERISRWGGFKEIYLAAEEDGWELPGYSDEGWTQAVEIAGVGETDSPWPNLIPREIPFLAKELRYAVSVVRTETNFGSVSGTEWLLIENVDRAEALLMDASTPGSLPAVVYDFGTEVVGRPILTIDAPKGGVIRIAYGESLELQEVDTFILKHGQQQLQPFGRRACRFLKVMLMAAPEVVTVKGLCFEQVGYPFARQTVFDSGNTRFDAIHEVSLYTTRMNCHDHTEDCPWREKALWVVDGMVMGKIIYANYADTTLMRKCLLQGARIQNKDGSIPGTGPERNAVLLPDFCAYWLLGVYDYWRYSGDMELLRELKPAIDRLMDWFERQTDETGLFARADRPGWWCFIDWTDDVDRRDKVSAISFLYYKALVVYERMQRALTPADAAVDRTSARAKRLNDVIRRQLWLPDLGLYVDCLTDEGQSGHFSLQTNFMAVWCGLMDKTETNRFLDDYYLLGKLPPVRGPFFQHIVLEVLRDAGRQEQALAVIQEYWGAMLNRGATTWWETFDASMPACTIPSTFQGHTPTYLQESIPVSLCHAWGASPAYLLNQLIFGVDLSEAGSRLIRLSPPYLTNGSARIAIPLPHDGTLTIQWAKLNGGDVTGEVTIPGGYQVIAPVSYPLRIVTELSDATPAS
ncbi:alpha-L-rhamnosidase N-terminal domain-containing protein [Paenibacillus oryzisoli]|uniref:family 78 glycoside hydrolase catalytic domain n=1 Tax=Paenibacillus oryzisoli TaxID=1850517 RepID=UPI003D2D9DA8